MSIKEATVDCRLVGVQALKTEELLNTSTAIKYADVFVRSGIPIGLCKITVKNIGIQFDFEKDLKQSLSETTFHFDEIKRLCIFNKYPDVLLLYLSPQTHIKTFIVLIQLESADLCRKLGKFILAYIPQQIGKDFSKDPQFNEEQGDNASALIDFLSYEIYGDPGVMDNRLNKHFSPPQNQGRTRFVYHYGQPPNQAYHPQMVPPQYPPMMQAPYPAMMPPQTMVQPLIIQSPPMMQPQPIIQPVYAPPPTNQQPMITYIQPMPMQMPASNQSPPIEVKVLPKSSPLPLENNSKKGSDHDPEEVRNGRRERYMSRETIRTERKNSDRPSSHQSRKNRSRSHSSNSDSRSRSGSRGRGYRDRRNSRYNSVEEDSDGQYFAASAKSTKKKKRFRFF